MRLLSLLLLLCTATGCMQKLVPCSGGVTIEEVFFDAFGNAVLKPSSYACAIEKLGRTNTTPPKEGV